jgi:uncharacterized Zn finger protein (UPF0148 family)
MNCPNCGEVLVYDRHRDRWYCPECNYASKRKAEDNPSRQRKMKEKNRYKSEKDED